MPNVYVVTDGDYSDYRIKAVFKFAADAAKYVEAGEGPDHIYGCLDDPEVEAWELLEGDTERVIIHEACQYFLADGTVDSELFIGENLILVVGGDDEGIPSGVEWAVSKILSIDKPYYQLRGRSRDKDRLLKAFGEKRAFISENPAWIDSFPKDDD